MNMKSVSFRMTSKKLERLDSLAGAQHRDRTFILNEAIDNYLDLYDYHVSLVEQGLRDIETGKVTSHEEVGRQLKAQRAARKAEAAR